jgi:flagellar motor switch protein FliN/FliY
VESATESEAAQNPPPAADARTDAAGNPFDEIAAEMAAEIEKAAREKQRAGSPLSASQQPDLAEAEPLALSDLDESEAEAGALAQGIGLLSDVELNVKIELGRTQKTIEEILALGAGSVVELDRLAGDPVDVYVNERLVARGEVLVLNDNLCIRVNEIVSEQAAVDVA